MRPLGHGANPNKAISLGLLGIPAVLVSARDRAPALSIQSSTRRRAFVRCVRGDLVDFFFSARRGLCL